MKKMATIDTQRKNMLAFQLTAYRNEMNQIQYIRERLTGSLKKRRLESAIFCMNELAEILHQIQIPLRVKQIHELYLYATYQNLESKADTKKKIAAIMNQQKKKVDIQAVAKWIHQQIQKNQIKFAPKTMRAHSQMRKKDKKSQNSIEDKLPPLVGTVSQKLQNQLKTLIDIFNQMEVYRQKSGLIPINLDGGEDLQIPSKYIPYDPDLFTLNKNLAKLRMKAEQHLNKIMLLAKNDKKLQAKLQDSIQKFQRMRIEANEKVGRNGAMKAQKRLLEAKKKERQSFQSINLGEEEDLIRASLIYSLVSMPQKKI